MFLPNKIRVLIDGVDISVQELTAKQAREIGGLDEWEATRRAFMLMVHKPSGEPFFASVDEIDDLPTHVVQKLGESIRELNEPKN